MTSFVRQHFIRISSSHFHLQRGFKHHVSRVVGNIMVSFMRVGPNGLYSITCDKQVNMHYHCLQNGGWRGQLFQRQLKETESTSVRFRGQCLLAIRFVSLQHFKDLRLCLLKNAYTVVLGFHVPASSFFFFCFSEVRDGQKRRRLEAAGQENQTPKPSTSRRLVEQETKPDTPMVPSIRSRVLQLTQRQDGNSTGVLCLCEFLGQGFYGSA